MIPSQMQQPAAANGAKRKANSPVAGASDAKRYRWRAASKGWQKQAMLLPADGSTRLTVAAPAAGPKHCSAADVRWKWKPQQVLN